MMGINDSYVWLKGVWFLNASCVENLTFGVCGLPSVCEGF